MTSLVRVSRFEEELSYYNNTVLNYSLYLPMNDQLIAMNEFKQGHKVMLKRNA